MEFLKAELVYMFPINFSPSSAEGVEEFADGVKLSDAEDLPILLSDFLCGDEDGSSLDEAGFGMLGLGACRNSLK